MQTIIRPIITEKSIKDANDGIFTFVVHKASSKDIIRKSIEKVFSVHVKSITTVTVKGKKRTVGRKRKIIYEPDSKKARVKLAPNEKIDLFEIGEKK